MRLKVRTFLITAFVVSSMAPLVVFWFWPHSAIMDSKVAEVRERHLLIARNLGAALETYHRDIMVALTSFAPEIAEGGGDTAKPIFQGLNFRHICVADPHTGKVVHSYLARDFECPDVIPPARLEMFNGLIAQNAIGMSGVVPVQGDRPRIFLVTPYKQRLVVAALHTDFFQALQKRISFGRRGYAAIVDNAGKVLAHPKQDWEQTAFDLSALAPVRQMILGETGVATFYSDAMEAEMIAGYTVASGPGWGVMVPQPLAELQEAAAQFNRDALVILSSGLLLSFMLALAVSGVFSRKIGSIAARVQQVGEGITTAQNVSRKAPLGVSELFALQQGVDKMAHATATTRAEINDRNQQLEQSNAALRLEIAEREVAEAQQKGSEARYRGLFDSAPIPIREEDLSGIKIAVDALGIKDPDKLAQYLDQNPDFVRQCGETIVVVDANLAAVELHGYPDKSKMLPKVTQELSPASMEVVRRTIVAIHAGQRHLSYQIPIYPSEGEVKHVASSWMVISGHEDTYRRILLTSIDLTERVKSEERILKAQKMEAVGQLTGGIAHDFNNLLTVIGGNADLIQEDISNAEDYVQPIRNAVSRGSELTQRLLAFSRQQPLAPVNLDLTELIGDMTEVLRRTLGEDVVIEVHFDKNLWTVLADPNQIANALLNLGLNARDAMPMGGHLRVVCRNVAVTGRDADDLQDGDYVVLQVTDDGMGMSDDALSHAFEPFFTTKSVGKGSGLGLSMVYGFAKQSNGHAEIESILHAGTTVRVLLPRGSAVIGAPHLDATHDAAPFGTGQSVLVLEDQEDVRTYLVRSLNLMGFHPLPAGDAFEARKILAHTSDIRVAICDIMLPGGMSGTDFATEAWREHPNLKVIFISGRPPVGQMPKASPLSESVLLTKPFDSKRLGELLQEYLIDA